MPGQEKHSCGIPVKAQGRGQLTASLLHTPHAPDRVVRLTLCLGPPRVYSSGAGGGCKQPQLEGKQGTLGLEVTNSNQVTIKWENTGLGKGEKD